MKLKNVEIQIIAHCNLNCKSCDHFSPIANKWEIDVNNYINELLLLKKYFEIEKITLIGGEPLLHTKLNQLLTETRNVFKSSRIVIFTNGTLIKKTINKLFKTMKQYDIEFQLTKYPIDFDYDSLIKILYQLGIKCYIENQCDKWFQYHIDNNNYPIYANCYSRESMDNFQLVNGKLSCCQIPAYIKYFNQYFNKDIYITKNDYLDLSNNLDEKYIKKYIDTFHNKGLNFCQYCHKVSESNWEISKKEITEWK